ncbi:hypothetical protein AALA44_02755 [Enterococcus ratti]|uniref:hypothetical protein n=1 Tax=Enterococcus ratti TaxID=150033 RepID=UPI0035110D2F
MNEKTLLIYGLAEERGKYAESIGYQFGGEFAARLCKDTSPFFINQYNDTISTILEDEKERKYWEKKDDTCWSSEEQFIKFSKEWINYVGEGRKHWRLWENYFRLTQVNPKNELKKIYKDEIKKKWPKCDLHIMRGCKIGLESAKFIPDLEIHFCLEKININGVISKDKTLYGDTNTSRELRYIYRNWEELKERVIFVEKREASWVKVKAPWVREPELWEAYKPKSWSQKKETAMKASDVAQQEGVKNKIHKNEKKKSRLSCVIKNARGIAKRVRPQLTNSKEKKSCILL